MENETFSVLVPYKGRMAIVAVTQVHNPVELQYEVVFPDGTYSFFHTNQGDRGWAEEEAEVTDLAKAIGPVIDMYHHEKYKEPFMLTAGGHNYAIQPFTEDEGKTIQYAVYEMTGEHLLSLSRNGANGWAFEPVAGDHITADQSLADTIGNAIINKDQ